jgi:DNA-directed RNA polymerase II subunit RPB1
MLEIYQEFLAIENGDDQDYDITAPWIIRLIFDKEKMMEKGIVMEDIYIKLMDYDSERILFTFTDDNCKELIGRISLKVDPAGSSDTQGIQDQTDIISIFKNINEDIMHNIAVKGIPNIEDIVVSDIKEMGKVDHTYKYVKKHILETDGTNLIKIMNNPYVDNSRVFSNDIIEMYEVLGIEAARTILIQEITDVVDHAGEYINNRHIELLCDTMTSKGELTSINRQGINRGDVGPLAKCSFEDTTDQLIKSGIFSEKDNLTGVSSNIMMGQMIKSGTGICNLLLDEKTLKKELKSIGFSADEFMQIDEDNIDVLMEMEDEGECGDNDFKFSFE